MGGRCFLKIVLPSFKMVEKQVFLLVEVKIMIKDDTYKLHIFLSFVSHSKIKWIFISLANLNDASPQNIFHVQKLMC